MLAPSPSTADVLDDVLGVLSAWLPGYDDRNPQSQIALVAEDGAGKQTYRYRPAAWTPRDEDRRFRVTVTVEEVT